MYTLDQLRTKIDDIDTTLIVLFVERFSLVKTIGMYKKEHQLPILDELRRSQLLKKNIFVGKEKGLSEDFIFEVRKTIHKEAQKIQ